MTAEDGRCRTLLAYGNVEQGRRDPHPGLGL